MARVKAPKVKNGDTITLKVIERGKVKAMFKTKSIEEARSYYSKKYETDIFCRVWINDRKLTIAEADLLLLHKRSPMLNTKIYWHKDRGGY
jgi:hypothetical protein